MPAAARERPIMAPRNPKSFRLTDEAVRILEELESHLGLSQTAVVEMALRTLYRKETGRKKPPEKPGRET
jgi:hypothetical protein